MNIHLQQCLEEDAASLGLRIINKDVAKIMTVKTSQSTDSYVDINEAKEFTYLGNVASTVDGHKVVLAFPDSIR